MEQTSSEWRKREWADYKEQLGEYAELGEARAGTEQDSSGVAAKCERVTLVEALARESRQKAGDFEQEKLKNSKQKQDRSRQLKACFKLHKTLKTIQEELEARMRNVKRELAQVESDRQCVVDDYRRLLSAKREEKERLDVINRNYYSSLVDIFRAVQKKMPLSDLPHD